MFPQVGSRFRASPAPPGPNAESAPSRAPSPFWGSPARLIAEVRAGGRSA